MGLLTTTISDKRDMVIYQACIAFYLDLRLATSAPKEHHTCPKEEPVTRKKNIPLCQG